MPVIHQPNHRAVLRRTVRIGTEPPYRYELIAETWEADLEIEVSQSVIDAQMLRIVNSGRLKGNLPNASRGPVRVTARERKLVSTERVAEPEPCTRAGSEG